MGQVLDEEGHQNHIYVGRRQYFSSFSMTEYSIIGVEMIRLFEHVGFFGKHSEKIKTKGRQTIQNRCALGRRK